MTTPTDHTYPHPDKVHEAAIRLSNLLMPRGDGKPLEGAKHTMAELRIAEDLSIVVGAYRFAGLIDDKNRVAVSFSTAEMSDYAHFDRLLKAPLTAAGYKFTNYSDKPVYEYGGPKPLYDQGVLIEVLKLLEERKVIPGLDTIFHGAVSPLSIGGRLKQEFGAVVPASAEVRIETPFTFLPGRVIA